MIDNTGGYGDAVTPGGWLQPAGRDGRRPLSAVLFPIAQPAHNGRFLCGRSHRCQQRHRSVEPVEDHIPDTGRTVIADLSSFVFCEAFQVLLTQRCFQFVHTWYDEAGFEKLVTAHNWYIGGSRWEWVLTQYEGNHPGRWIERQRPAAILACDHDAVVAPSDCRLDTSASNAPIGRPSDLVHHGKPPTGYVVRRSGEDYTWQDERR